MVVALDLIEIDPVKREEDVEEVKRRALKDANAYIEDALIPDYSKFKNFLVVTNADRIVATGGYRSPEGEITEVLNCEKAAELKNLHTLPSYQRNGYASEILKRLEEKASEDGYRKFVLETTEFQDSARKFYKSKGFDEADRREVEFEGMKFSVIFYCKPI
jgi:GNAT superfamily N-acetyltransferase